MADQLRLPDEYVAGMLNTLAPHPLLTTARAEIDRLQADGLDRSAIARSLNARGFPTPSGRGRWHPETVGRQLDPDTWAAYMRRYRARLRR